MTITISGQPTVVDSPGFAGLTIHVPLSSSPPPGWLDRLVVSELPGKGHRVVEDGIEFHLDRGARDVAGAIKAIAKAIENTSVPGAEAAARDAQRAQSAKAAREKAARALAAWWESVQPKPVDSGGHDPAGRGGEQPKGGIREDPQGGGLETRGP